MKIRILLIVALCQFLFICGYSQSTEFPGTVTLGNNSKVYKIVTVPSCDYTHNPTQGTIGTVYLFQKKFKNDNTEITVIDTVVTKGNSPNKILINKELDIDIFPNSSGKANLYLKDTDKSILHVNYWLNNSYTVKSNTKVQEFTTVYDCNKNVSYKSGPIITLGKDKVYYAEEIKATDPKLNSNILYKNSKRTAVFNSSGTIDYYLVESFDRNAKFKLELENREVIKYKSKSLDLGALTIPFKYRFGFESGNKSIKPDVIAGFNIGAYGGYKLSKYSIINKAGTYINKTVTSFRVGPFINFSSATLDSANTSVGETPYKKDDKLNIAVISTGLAAMVDIKGVQFGLYGGWDIGAGKYAKDWNYNKKFWLGFGIGYKLTDLFAKKD